MLLVCSRPTEMSAARLPTPGSALHACEGALENVLLRVHGQHPLSYVEPAVLLLCQVSLYEPCLHQAGC